MKLWHIMVAGIIAVGMIVTFTGFLSTLTPFNSDINLTAFNSYDLRTDYDTDLNILKNTSDSEAVTNENAEQNLYQKFSSGMKDAGGSFVGSYKIINTASEQFNLPAIIFWTITAILFIFILIKTIGGWLFDK